MSVYRIIGSLAVTYDAKVTIFFLPRSFKMTCEEKHIHNLHMKLIHFRDQVLPIKCNYILNWLSIKTGVLQNIWLTCIMGDTINFIFPMLIFIPIHN